MLQINKINEDERGAIYLIEGDDLQWHDEITLFVTKRGYARGGCIHKISNEHCLVLEGIITYIIGDDGPEKMNKGTTAFIPKNTPHYFISNTDSIVIEWGATPEEKVDKHPQFRKRVEHINEQANSDDD
jgi:mannose-6-phosphate isomerase-like protein (cupin superfamily)